MKKRLTSLFLAVVMLVGMIPVLSTTAEAAASPVTLEGMTFPANELYEIPDSKLNVTKPETGDEGITFEAEIYIPYSMRNKRSGVILGSYNGSTKIKDIGFEIESNGRVRLYTSHMGQVYFDDDGGRSTAANSDATNVFTYMGGESEAKFLKIAVVINTTQKKASLYFNGVKVSEFDESDTAVTFKYTSGGFVTANNLCLGGDYRDGNSQNFKGSIKNLTLYSDVRTDAELLASGTASSYSVDSTDENLLLAYNLNNKNAPLKDLSANGRHISYIENEEVPGMTFSADKLYKIPYKLNLDKPDGADEAITFESEIYIPLGNKAYRNGVILGTYSDGTKADMNFEIAENGRVRFYSSHITKTGYFDDDGTRDTLNNADATNIFTYMGGGKSVKFVKIAVVINITQATSLLYINGTKVAELALDKRARET